MTALLEIDGLVKSFRAGATARRAVDGISFTLRRGEALGLAGESGSGKTTLGLIIARLVAEDAGRILFEGQDLAKTPIGQAAFAPWRSRIQFVFQDAGASLVPHQSAVAAVAGPLQRLKGLTRRAAIAAAERTLTDVGLEEPLFLRRPHGLSGGQLARVGIARAIALEPDLLILDEPTAALDVSVQAGILHLLDRLRRERGLGVLFVSHDLNVIRLVCQRVLVMRGGTIVESGPTTSVLDQPTHPFTVELLAALPRLSTPED
jgi:ABC-type dipeptide/oligopeptide/nickel transport system ATPase subunit